MLEDLENIGALGSGGSEVRGGGKFCSIACRNGSAHGKLQNCHAEKASEEVLKEKQRDETYAGRFVHVNPRSINVNSVCGVVKQLKFIIPIAVR
jgi:hypothetical protein